MMSLHRRALLAAGTALSATTAAMPGFACKCIRQDPEVTRD